MAGSKINDLKYNGEKLNIEQFLETEDLPAVVRVRNVDIDEEQTSGLGDRSLLLHRVSKEPFVHIKVLKFYNNAKMQSEKGGEYVLEHDTFVGNEYLLPLKFPGEVHFVRRPGSRGRYLTIKQVVGDCPAFVKAENEVKGRLSPDMTQIVTIPAKSILELKRIHTNGEDISVWLECSDGVKMYTFHENDVVNFTVYERNKLYSLRELSETTLLPKVILFKEIDPEDAVLKDNQMRSALLTMIEGPLEVLGFTDVEFLICWVRNKKRMTYETVLIPKTLWNKIYLQKRCFADEFDKEIHIKRKYKQCLASDFLSKSLYILPVDESEVIWLRSPDLFKRNLNDPNKLYEVVNVPFEDSSDDGDDNNDETHIYSEITEPPPPLPPKSPITSPRRPPISKGNHSFTKTVKALFTTGRTHKGRNVTKMEQRPNRPPKPQLLVQSDVSQADGNQSLDSRPLPYLPTDGFKCNKYTKLKLRSVRDYEKANFSEISVLNPEESGELHGSTDETKQTEENVLRDNQSAENFFKYSVGEVSFCFEHCGLKDLAGLCSEHMLDGTFFKGFIDWKLFDLSQFDVTMANKVIYQGWRPKTDEST